MRGKVGHQLGFELDVRVGFALNCEWTTWEEFFGWLNLDIYFAHKDRIFAVLIKTRFTTINI
jgi:hypothetical protein